ncbi:WD repeat-containing protein 38-like [Copidosoma floridanum]|uniref:WD repeat-containing protein 38-like n=1 Tax=Copidosoma floridanum TaxID=29053 RepID=UPI0006C9721C|nr:WD repeat-containing protein 38-like [Copidosoma floridanum]
MTGFFVERKVSQEEIEERKEWIQAKKSKSQSMKDRNYAIKQINFSEKLDGLYSVRFSPDGDLVATTFGSGCIHLRNGETGERRETIRCGLETSSPVTCCRFHPIYKDHLYASGSCGTIFHCRVNEIEFWRFSEELGNEINAIDISVSGEHIFSVGKNASLNEYDLETARVIRNFKKDPHDVVTDNVIKYHTSRIFAVKCHKTDANLVITGGWDNTLKIWDIRVSDGSIKSINGPHVCGDAIDLKDTKILSGSWVDKDSLQLWDMTSAKLIETITPTNRQPTAAGEFLYCAQFFDGDPYDNHAIIGGSGTGAVEIVNLKEKTIVASFNANKAVIALDSHKTRIVYGGMDHTINFAEYN